MCALSDTGDIGVSGSTAILAQDGRNDIQINVIENNQITQQFYAKPAFTPPHKKCFIDARIDIDQILIPDCVDSNVRDFILLSVVVLSFNRVQQCLSVHYFLQFICVDGYKGRRLDGYILR